jgi:hypothetical protein
MSGPKKKNSPGAHVGGGQMGRHWRSSWSALPRSPLKKASFASRSILMLNPLSSSLVQAAFAARAK